MSAPFAFLYRLLWQSVFAKACHSFESRFNSSFDSPFNIKQVMKMAQMRVTLKTDLKHGEFYWVTTVSADSEDEAVVAAENLFQAEMERMSEWEFTDYNVDPA